MFQMRTSCPYDNKYYITTDCGGWSWAIKGNPTKNGANVLSNCVGYANGRFAEIIGKNCIEYQLVCNAENFIEKARNYGLEISDKPVLGGIMVWQKGSTLSDNDGAGHVAIVEKVIDNNTIYTSESAWGGSAFYNATRSNNNGRWGMGSAYSFRGCIVNPTHPHDDGNMTAAYQTWLNGTYGYNLVVDGIFGNDTHKHAVMALQTEFNKQLGANLVVDGIFGNVTKNACPNLRVGMSGNITRNVQYMLATKGYNIGSYGADGIYGNATKNAVINFQKDHGLDADGICGRNTFERLFK